MSLYGGVEGGGTKFLCLVGSDPNHILTEAAIPTTTPDETIGHVIDFFLKVNEKSSIAAIGVGCFGPLDLDRTSPSFGYITNTPKPG